MTDARAVLDEIQQRADLNSAAIGNLRSLANHAKPNREAGEGAELVARDRASALRCAEELREARADVPKLVAALRAVLANHWCIEGGEECGFDGRFWPCPDYRAITEALGGTDA